ncbi:MAG: enoyl-[acyl-carrier-protein] reductase FabL [Ardenticatenia bacterium]|jgi:enoyl-[acyl-carrier protein] reductase III|nr:MAG: enoyl-[acyl-carrier-protein] reductase FabL [Ardenticatenia bacterium]
MGEVAYHLADNKPLQGRVALITGASRGIGRAIALELARRGADIVVNFLRRRSAAEEVVSAIQVLGQRAVAIKANVGEAEEIDRMFDQVQSEFGRCDILVGNAATGVIRPIIQLEDKHWDWTLDINARSILRCARRAIPFMEAQGWGRIIGITSFGSTRVFPEYGIVGVSKAAIEALIRYLAVDLAPKGIIVNAVSPGVVDTDALKYFPIDLEKTLREGALRTPARRLATPEDIAKVVAFLCSDDAAMIVGQTIVVDGGWSILA